MTPYNWSTQLLDSFGVRADLRTLPSEAAWGRAARRYFGLPRWLRWAFPGRRAEMSRLHAQVRQEWMESLMREALP